jgi:hypothetical protein
MVAISPIPRHGIGGKPSPSTRAPRLIVVSGVYPDARYASFAVYSSSELPFTSNGVVSSLADFQIAPDPGSANPWRRAAAPGGHFTLNLRMQVAPGQINVLPLAPEGVTSGVGYLEYRVYLPATGGASHIPLPHITVENRGSTQQLRACISHTTAIPPPVRPSATPQATTPSSRPRAASRRLSSSGRRSRPTSQNPRRPTSWPTRHLRPPPRWWW